VLGSELLVDSDATLQELGLIDGAIVTLVCSSDEQHLNPQALKMIGLERNQVLEERAMRGYVQDYRLRRQTGFFAAKAAESRAPHRAVDFPSASGICSRCDIPGADIKLDNMEYLGSYYESQRRTVSWALQAAIQRELRLSALVQSGPGQICIGAKPPLNNDVVPDAKWGQDLMPCGVCKVLHKQWWTLSCEMASRFCSLCANCHLSVSGGSKVNNPHHMWYTQPWAVISSGASVEDVISIACDAARLEDIHISKLVSEFCQEALVRAVQAKKLTHSNVVGAMRRARPLSDCCNYVGVWSTLCQAVRNDDKLCNVVISIVQKPSSSKVWPFLDSSGKACCKRKRNGSEITKEEVKQISIAWYQDSANPSNSRVNHGDFFMYSLRWRLLLWQ